jgi:glycosyltransferase involved in cell wall biosynthesis
MRLGVDLTACWRPRVGMMTVAVELTHELMAQVSDPRRLTLFCSRRRPPGLESAAARFVLSPWRHEVLNKLRWLPAVEADAGLDAMLYPYWPSPPRRRPGAPPAAVFVHDLAFRVRPDEVPWQQRAYLGSVLGPSLRQAAAVMTPSQATRRDLLLHYPIQGLADRVHVVPEGRSLDRVEPGSLPEGLTPGCFLLAVGTIEPRKNYPRLLQAYRLLKDRDLSLPLVVVGRVGWAYGRALDDLRDEPGIRLLGHVDDATLRALYRSASVLAFPSLHEGFGLPLLEAFSEGLPAVVGASGALPELAGEAALLVDPLDPQAIADALEQALTDAGLRARLGAAGRQRAAAYTWEAAAAAVIGIVGAMLGSPS